MLFSFESKKPKAVEVTTAPLTPVLMRADIALAEAEVRKSVLQMAKQGSTPAQKQFMDLNKRAKNLKLKRP